MADYYVYIMTNTSRTLYVGVTNNLERRVHEHKLKATPGFTAKYNITKLAYFESTPSREFAIAWEKQIKGWLRKKKITLIESMNPGWADLSLSSTSPENEILRFAQDDVVADLGGIRALDDDPKDVKTQNR